MNNQKQPSMKSRTRINQSAAILWASAFVLTGMVIMQAGRMVGPNTANAEMATNRASYSLLTTNSGRGGEAQPDELLYVINAREETILVYEIEDARKGQILLRDGGPLPNLFRAAQ